MQKRKLTATKVKDLCVRQARISDLAFVVIFC